MSQSSCLTDRFWPLMKYTDLRPQFADRKVTDPSLRICLSVQRRQLTICQGALLVEKLDPTAATVRARLNAVAFRAGLDGSRAGTAFKHFRVRFMSHQERTGFCSTLSQIVRVEESQLPQESPVLAPPLQPSSTPRKRESMARDAEKESLQWKPTPLQQTKPEDDKAFTLHQLPPPAYRTPKRAGEPLSTQDLSTPAKKKKQCVANGAQQSIMAQPASKFSQPPRQNQNAWQARHSPMAEHEMNDSDSSSDCASLDSSFSSQDSSSSQMSWPPEMLPPSQQKEKEKKAGTSEKIFFSSSPSSQPSKLSGVPKQCYSNSSARLQQAKPILLKPRSTMSQGTQTDPEDPFAELEALQPHQLSEFLCEITQFGCAAKMAEQPGFVVLLGNLARVLKDDDALSQRMEEGMRGGEMAEETDDDEEEVLSETPPPGSPERQEEEEAAPFETALLGLE